MWFLWFSITFLVAIVGIKIVFGNIVAKIWFPEALQKLPYERQGRLKWNNVVPAIFMLLWIILSFTVPAIKNEPIALIVGWVLGLIGAAINIFKSKLGLFTDILKATKNKNLSDNENLLEIQRLVLDNSKIFHNELHKIFSLETIIKYSQEKNDENFIESNEIYDATNIVDNEFIKVGTYAITEFFREEKLDGNLTDIKVKIGNYKTHYEKNSNVIYISINNSVSKDNFLNALKRCFQQAVCVKDHILYSSTPMGQIDSEVNDEDLFGLHDDINDNVENKKIMKKIQEVINFSLSNDDNRNVTIDKIVGNPKRYLKTIVKYSIIFWYGELNEKTTLLYLDDYLNDSIPKGRIPSSRIIKKDLTRINRVINREDVPISPDVDIIYKELVIEVLCQEMSIGKKVSTTIHEIIRMPSECLSLDIIEQIKMEFGIVDGFTAFMYLRKYFLEKHKELRIISDNEGNILFGRVVDDFIEKVDIDEVAFQQWQEEVLGKKNISFGEKCNDEMEDFLDMSMSLDYFAELQGYHPWFDSAVMMDQIRPIIFDRKTIMAREDNFTWTEQCMMIFGLIFGAYGLKKDLDGAWHAIVGFYNSAINEKPNQNINDEKYIEWLNRWGEINILMGTIFAYKKEYIKAACHFMRGLKTEAINLNMPYVEFIQYILKKLDTLQYKESTYYGCGFEKDNPMGAIDGNVLFANKAIEIIPEMEGKLDDVIVAKAGKSAFLGHLVRKGSTKSATGKMVDIYETYIIDYHYNLMKVNIYFNGYFKGHSDSVKIAQGFIIKPNSLIKSHYSFIDSKLY